MADWDFILAPATVTVQFKLDEVAILNNSLRLLGAWNSLSGLGGWVTEVANDLPDKRMYLNEIVSETLSNVLCDLPQVSTFPEYIAQIADIDEKDLFDGLIGWLQEAETYSNAVLESEETFIAFAYETLNEKYAKKGIAFEDNIWRMRYHFITHPEEFRDIATNHMQFMWDNYLRDEWKRVKPMLQEAYDAHINADYDGMTGFEAIEAITGRNMRSSEHMANVVEKADILTFIPSPHVGPYIGFGGMNKNEQILFFGARLPKNTAVKSTALSRSELLVRLNALADETRLKILELLTEHNELCAQDFITTLDLSQSSASRHLRQLTASGYLSERRRDVAKCYSLNPERIDDTIRALKDFLQG